MPYITQKSREELLNRNPKTVGELNYQITNLCLQFIICNGGLNYSNINSIMGAIECSKMEIYRRLASPYEDEKIKENGDINWQI